MACIDWRRVEPAAIAPLLEAEMRAWRRDLDWDVTEAWQVIEPARRAGSLPGFVVTDAHGHRLGWTSFLVHRDCLQVLTFVAPDAGVAQQLVEAVLASPEAARAESVIVCVRAASSRLAGILAERGFEVEPYRYLRRDLDATAEAPVTGIEPWRAHTEPVARLAARVYADAPQVRAFAPHGTMDEWCDYIAGLVKGPGCGWFARGLSFVVPAPGGPDLLAAALVTELGPGTAHVAQLVVDPAARGRGLARGLIRAATAAAYARGYHRMTLLVSASNRPAVALYDRLGFVDRASFVVAARPQPSLLTSVALATGGVSTRR